MTSHTARVWALAALAAAAVGATVWYTAGAMRRASGQAEPVSTVGAPPALGEPPPRPYLLVRSTAADWTWRRLVLVPMTAPSGPGFVTPLACERAYFAVDRGICLLEASEGLTTRYYADVFDERFVPLHRIPLTGVPSRTRVSPNGRRAAITVFEQGHSYAETGFSTRTILVDTTTGTTLADLESFDVTRDGARFRAVDFNFWGVTFAQDSNRFFATLASAGVKHLVEGDVDARRARVVRAGIECPSLSPDNTRIAYKHLLRADGFWQLRVYDLRTGTETSLVLEERSVDDQVEWADNERLMYHVTGERGADIWAMRADGTAAPELVRSYAYAPASVR